MEDKVLEFLKGRQPKLCVLATASTSGKTEAAVVGYAVQNNLTIICSTRSITRKYHNILQNPHVSVVVGWNFSEKNIQIDGTAQLVESGNAFMHIEQFFFTQNPDASAFKTEDSVLIIIKPTWMRLLDPFTHPSTMEEKVISSSS